MKYGEDYPEVVSPSPKRFGLALRHWTAIGGVLVGLLAAVPLYEVSKNTIKSANARETVRELKVVTTHNCQQLELIKTAIRATIQQSVDSLGKPGTADYAYYRTHPPQVVAARQQALKQLARFRALKC